MNQQIFHFLITPGTNQFSNKQKLRKTFSSDEGDTSSSSSENEGKCSKKELEGPCCQPSLQVPPSSPVLPSSKHNKNNNKKVFSFFYSLFLKLFTKKTFEDYKIVKVKNAKELFLLAIKAGVKQMPKPILSFFQIAYLFKNLNYA